MATPDRRSTLIDAYENAAVIVSGIRAAACSGLLAAVFPAIRALCVDVLRAVSTE